MMMYKLKARQTVGAAGVTAQEEVSFDEEAEIVGNF